MNLPKQLMLRCPTDCRSVPAFYGTTTRTRHASYCNLGSTAEGKEDFRASIQAADVMLVNSCLEHKPCPALPVLPTVLQAIMSSLHRMHSALHWLQVSYYRQIFQ